MIMLSLITLRQLGPEVATLRSLRRRGSIQQSRLSASARRNNGRVPETRARCCLDFLPPPFSFSPAAFPLRDFPHPLARRLPLSLRRLSPPAKSLASSLYHLPVGGRREAVERQPVFHAATPAKNAGPPYARNDPQVMSLARSAILRPRSSWLAPMAPVGVWDQGSRKDACSPETVICSVPLVFRLPVVAATSFERMTGSIGGARETGVRSKLYLY